MLAASVRPGPRTRPLALPPCTPHLLQWMDCAARPRSAAPPAAADRCCRRTILCKAGSPTAMWFEGSVAEAITASRQEGKPLLVLLTGEPP